jgi:hypothetical protein
VKRLSLYSAIAILVGIFSGCSENSNPTAPIARNQTAVTMPLSQVSLFALPRNSSATKLESIESNTVVITPEVGGDVPVEYEYTSGSKTVKISMNLHFAPGSIDVSTPITISLNTETLTADFSPSGIVFAKAATLTASVYGLDLSSVPANADVSLFYINNSTCEPMPGSVSLDVEAGSLVLTNGQIPHFSLYGFGFIK